MKEYSYKCSNNGICTTAVHEIHTKYTKYLNILFTGKQHLIIIIIMCNT